ncbi:MAG: terpene cyclase/mutase family protein [Planctomycetes bacterium]|nr:terpene cyclase/mutase family protein [Planctomycetota bacterium]
MARFQPFLPAFSSLCLALVLGWSQDACAQQAPPSESNPSESQRAFREITPDARRAINDGIAWLAKNQLTQSGRWVSRPPRYQMSITALAGLALMAHGVTPDRGPYARVLRRALNWVLENQHREGEYVGLLCDQRDVMSDKARPMHGHGFALLLLGQAYGTSHDEALRTRIGKAIKAGIRLTEKTTSRDGGWFYWPRTDRGDEGSVTITQIQALRSARNCGFGVDKTTLARAVLYIRESQGDDGGVHYQRPRRGPSSPALTAAGIVVFQDSGTYYDKAIEKAYGYLRRTMRVRAPDEERWFYYTHLYVSQAMFARGGPAWRSYFPRIRQQLLSTHTDKHWDSNLGPTYGTSVALLILQLPDRLLPIYQR